MDAETRHQLKQNELAEALTRLSKLNDKRLGYAIVALVVIAIVYVGFRVQRNRHQSTLAAGWEALATVSVMGGDASVQQLRNLIDTTTDAPLADAATLKLAMALKQRALSGDQAAGAEAIKVLQGVVDDDAAPASLRAAAQFNIGFLHENAREFDAARTAYTRLSDSAEFAGLPYPDLAAERLEGLDELTSRVEFEPGFPELDLPMVTTPPTTAPSVPTSAPTEATTQPEAGDIDGPEPDSAEQATTDEPGDPAIDTPEQP